MHGPDLASERQQSVNTTGQPPAPDRQEFILSPADFRKILFKRKYVVLGFFLAGVAIAAIITYLTVPVYEAISRIDINPGRASDLGISDLLQNKMGGGDESTRLLTEVRVLQSDSVLLAVAE